MRFVVERRSREMHAVRQGLWIVCCVLLLSACRFPGAVRPTAKIGLVAPFEGRYRYVGYDVVYAVRLALREANATGGVGGYSVELVAYDDGADPTSAVEQAHKLAVDYQVVAAIGHFREETTAASAEIYTESGVLLVSPGLIAPHADVLAAELLRYLEDAGLDRVVLLSDGGHLGAAVQRQEQVSMIVSPDDADWRSSVLRVSAGAVICDADPVTAGEVAAALHDAGWQGIFLGGPELAAVDFAAVAGEAAEGAFFVTPYPFPQDIPGSADFAAAYQAVSAHVPPPGPLALPAYETAWALLDALEQDIAAHGAPTREGMVSALALTEPDGAPSYWYRIGAEGVPERVP